MIQAITSTIEKSSHKLLTMVQIVHSQQRKLAPSKFLLVSTWSIPVKPLWLLFRRSIFGWSLSSLRAVLELTHRKWPGTSAPWDQKSQTAGLGSVAFDWGHLRKGPEGQRAHSPARNGQGRLSRSFLSLPEEVVRLPGLLPKEWPDGVWIQTASNSLNSL